MDREQKRLKLNTFLKKWKITAIRFSKIINYDKCRISQFRRGHCEIPDVVIRLIEAYDLLFSKYKDLSIIADKINLGVSLEP